MFINKLVCSNSMTFIGLNDPPADEVQGYSAKSGIYSFVEINGLEGKCTDQISPEHINSDKLIFISHPNWARLGMAGLYNHDMEDGLAKKSHVELDKQNLGLPELRLELLLEELVEAAEQSNVPVVLSVPCDYSDVNWNYIDTNGFTFTAKDNRSQGATAFLNSLAKGKPNVYFLPTYPDSGVIVTDSFGRKNHFKNSVEYIKRSPLKTMMPDPRFETIANREGFLECTKVESMIDVEKFVCNGYEAEDLREIGAHFGDDTLKRINADLKQYMTLV